MKYKKYELVLKTVKVHELKRDYLISNSDEVIAFAKNVLKMHTFPEERFYCVTIDAKGEIIGFSEVSKGDLTSSSANPREVYKMAIMQNAAAIICAHNHPSGDVNPSDEDIKATARLKEAGEILGIRFLDHIICGATGRGLSMKAEGML